MRSIPFAMIWELLQRGRWEMLLAILGSNLFPVLILTALRFDRAIDPTDRAFVTIHFVLVQMSVFAFAVAIISTQGAAARIYTLPVRTSSLVVWRMFPAMALMALQSVFGTSMLNWLYDLDWPLCAPALYGAVVLAALQSAFWFSEKSQLSPLFVCVAVGMLGFWYKSRFGPMFANPLQIWREVSAGDAATLVLFAVGSFVVAQIGVARNRCGEPLAKHGLTAWFESVISMPLELHSMRVHRFQTRLQAQFWSEWYKKGWALPITVVFGLTIWFAIWILFVRDPKELIQGLVAGGAVLSVAGMIGGLIVGNCGHNEANIDVGPFLGTRPISDVELACTILKVAGRSVLISWGIWAGAFAVVIALLTAAGVSIVPLLPAELQWWYLPATLLGFWIAVGSFTAVTLTGRGQLFIQAFSSWIAFAIGSILFSKLLSHEMQALLLAAAQVIAGIAIGAGSLWVMIAARRQALIHAKLLAITGAVWAVLSIVAVSECMRQPTVQLPAAVLLTGLASLVVAPLAAAPLAVTWNRHR